MTSEGAIDAVKNIFSNAIIVGCSTGEVKNLKKRQRR
jgi:hypothetical protein